VQNAGMVYLTLQKNVTMITEIQAMDVILTVKLRNTINAVSTMTRFPKVNVYLHVETGIENHLKHVTMVT